MVTSATPFAARMGRSRQRIPDDVQLEVLSEQVLVVELLDREVPYPNDEVMMRYVAR